MPEAVSRATTESGAPTGPVSTIVLAAGEGTRMRSAMPKVLHQMGGRTLIEHAVRAVAGVEPDHLVVVIGHGRDTVADHVIEVAKSVGTPITVAVQDKQRGTGHAVSCALAALPDDIGGTVVVSYGDVPLLATDTVRDLLAAHADGGHGVTVLTALAADPTGYGRIIRDADGMVVEIVEQADATEEQRAITEVNSGVYAFDAHVLTAALAQLSTDNAQGELYLTDVLAIARRAGQRVGALACQDPWQVEGVNDRVQLSGLAGELNRRLVRAWMKAGVTVIDPATTWLDMDVTLARDVTLAPGVQLHGTTSVGEGARIGPDTTLTDVTIGAGAVVVRTHGSGAWIGQGANVGPYAYLRPGTRLGEDGKIGTFVETKNAEIGAGSKVPHLTYVGDATIGEHSNIGASSVFVNYDGVNKHRSVVGSHVKMGSDNMYVAPVTIGDGAYSAAGTVLRRDVPPGALAVSGGPQRNIENWVLRRRAGTQSAEAAQRALDARAEQGPDAQSETDAVSEAEERDAAE